MRPLLLIVMALLLTPNLSTGQNKRHISLPYTIDDFSVVKNDKGQMAILSEKTVAMYKSDKTGPGLPFIGINVLVAPSEEYESATLSGAEVIVNEGVELCHNPKYILNNSWTMDNLDPSIVSYKEKNYPIEPIEYTGCSKMGGYKILSFLISPFSYDVATKTISFTRNPVLHLSTKGQIVKGRAGQMGKTVKEMVINGNDTESLYPRKTEKSTQIPSTFSAYQYIIVTNNSLKPTFQVLADWKTQKGVPTLVLTTEQISAYSGSTLQEKIKKVLKIYYDNTNGELTYVLLGGDVGIVPTQICYAKYDNEVRNMPTDMYYACFDTMNWDTNNNGIYGEISDNVDLLPEIYVSRASVNNISQAEVFVNRIISYESNPSWGNNSNKMLMAGAARQTVYDSNYGKVSDSQWHSYMLYRDYVQPYWNGTKMEFFDTHTDFPGDSLYEFSSAHLQDQLEQGYGFVHIMTHGSPWTMAMESPTDKYNINNAASLENQGETVFVTSTCLTNAFDSITTCLSESLMRNGDSGILAYVGCSRESWGVSEPLFIGPSNFFSGNVMKKFFTLYKNNFARCVMDGKSALISSCYSYDFPYRWILFGLNAMGDPEMPIYTTTPHWFNNVSIVYKYSGLSLNTNVDSCHIYITGRDNPCFLDFNNISSISGYTLQPGEYNVCVTKHGYVPYSQIINVRQEVYLQNEIFNSYVDITGPYVYIGSDIDPTIPQGPVVIENGGHLMISSQNGVYIKNGFEVKSGAIFEITQ